MREPRREGSIGTLGLDLGTSGGDWLFTRGGMLFGPAPAGAVIEQLLAGELDGNTPIAREGEAMRPLAQVPFFRVHLARAEARWRVVAEKREQELVAARRRRMRMALVGGGAALAAAAAVTGFVIFERRADAEALAEVSVELDPPRIEAAVDAPGEELAEYIEDDRPGGDGSAPARPRRKRPGGSRTAAPAPSQGPSPASTARADADGLATEVGYDRAAIDRALRAQQPTLFPCVKQAAAADPGLRGEVPFSFTVGNDGRVVKVWVDRDGYEKGALFDCLSEKARSMKFPTFQGERPTVSLAFRVR